MNQSYSVNILAQVSEGELISEGMSGHGSQRVAINNAFSFFGLAEDKGDPTGQSAHLALEILLDDIQTNLSSREYEQATEYEKHVQGTQCIEESFENINDYLITQGTNQSSVEKRGVALSVLQVIHGECSFIHADEHCCLHFREGKLMNLSQINSSDDDPKTLLGITETLHIKINQLSMTSNDLLLSCSHDLFHYVTEDFLRVTLSRFMESPEMAMRQITSKAQRNGMQGKPLLIMVAVKKAAEKPKSWFGR